VLPSKTFSEDKATPTLPTHPGRDSHALIEDRRSESHLTDIDAALQERSEEPAGDRQATCVAHIVEGSVQKSGDAVRVNVQLIKAATDPSLADTLIAN